MKNPFIFLKNKSHSNFIKKISKVLSGEKMQTPPPPPSPSPSLSLVEGFNQYAPLQVQSGLRRDP